MRRLPCGFHHSVAVRKSSISQVCRAGDVLFGLHPTFLGSKCPLSRAHPLSTADPFPPCLGPGIKTGLGLQIFLWKSPTCSQENTKHKRLAGCSVYSLVSHFTFRSSVFSDIYRIACFSNCLPRLLVSLGGIMFVIKLVMLLVIIGLSEDKGSYFLK